MATRRHRLYLQRILSSSAQGDCFLLHVNKITFRPQPNSSTRYPPAPWQAMERASLTPLKGWKDCDAPRSSLFHVCITFLSQVSQCNNYFLLGRQSKTHWNRSNKTPSTKSLANVLHDSFYSVVLVLRHQCIQKSFWSWKILRRRACWRSAILTNEAENSS